MCLLGYVCVRWAGCGCVLLYVNWVAISIRFASRAAVGMCMWLFVCGDEEVFVDLRGWYAVLE